MKVCNQCAVKKPLSLFHRNSRWSDGRDNKCKECTAANKKAAYWSDPAKARERGRRAAATFRATHKGHWKQYMDSRFSGGAKEWKRKYNLQKTYGLTWEGFVALLEKQGGRCAICKCEPSPDRFDRAWQVDHCHATGKVRGLLCRDCNWALGHFKDDVMRLGAAIAYLRRHTK